jgi:hypothetical protein
MGCASTGPHRSLAHCAAADVLATANDRAGQARRVLDHSKLLPARSGLFALLAQGHHATCTGREMITNSPSSQRNQLANCWFRRFPPSGYVDCTDIVLLQIFMRRVRGDDVRLNTQPPHSRRAVFVGQESARRGAAVVRRPQAVSPTPGCMHVVTPDLSLA